MGYERESVLKGCELRELRPERVEGKGRTRKTKDHFDMLDIQSYLVIHGSHHYLSRPYFN